jgi:hypothetical protein
MKNTLEEGKKYDADAFLKRIGYKDPAADPVTIGNEPNVTPLKIVQMYGCIGVVGLYLAKGDIRLVFGAFSTNQFLQDAVAFKNNLHGPYLKLDDAKDLKGITSKEFDTTKDEYVIIAMRGDWKKDVTPENVAVDANGRLKNPPRRDDKGNPVGDFLQSDPALEKAGAVWDYRIYDGKELWIGANHNTKVGGKIGVPQVIDAITTKTLTEPWKDAVTNTPHNAVIYYVYIFKNIKK